MKDKPIEDQFFELRIILRLYTYPGPPPVLFDSENSTCNYYDAARNSIIIFLHIVFSGILEKSCMTCNASVLKNMHMTVRMTNHAV